MNWAHDLASPVVGFALYAIVVFFLVFLPVIKIMRRIGRSAWWSFCIHLATWSMAPRLHAMARD